MELTAFLHALQTRRVVTTETHRDVAFSGLDQSLRELDQMVRINGHAELPEFHLAAACWATEELHAVWLALPHPAPESGAPPAPRLTPCALDRAAPSTHYSVDLTMRHLRHLWQQTQGIASAAPLLDALRAMATAWPLSSVGIKGLSDEEIAAMDATPVLANAGLRRMYVDRILRLRDETRTRDPAVAAAVATGIEEHRDFARSVLAVHDDLIKPRTRKEPKE